MHIVRAKHVTEVIFIMYEKSSLSHLSDKVQALDTGCSKSPCAFFLYKCYELNNKNCLKT